MSWKCEACGEWVAYGHGFAHKNDCPKKPKCTCAQPHHHTPMWWCAEHGEVVVPMD